ncbi:hypothetical protein EJ02DRAFT_490281 [Clathrospora elynae]|uniref:Uncharacterized protein n=1 Tax=Clathrospora elynae TaxID=706981 RepID=A0A6A5S4E0_9PLEO|nr:hypothetical protein EJ02DRAFT_490281 [Clathrospora elynae]
MGRMPSLCAEVRPIRDASFWICHEGFLLHLLAQDPVLLDHGSCILPSTINPSVDCAPLRIKEECLELCLDKRRIPSQLAAHCARNRQGVAWGHVCREGPLDASISIWVSRRQCRRRSELLMSSRNFGVQSHPRHLYS